MKISIDPKTNLPRFNLEEKDLNDAREIQVMMGSKGWKILHDYVISAREQILEVGKSGISSRAKRDLSDLKWAVLKGWDECSILADRVVARAQEFKDQERDKLEEEKNARPMDGFDDNI